MGWFSSSNEPTGNTNASSYPTTTNPSSHFAGSGAEQDRYGAHLSGIGEKAADKIKDATSGFRGTGTGAEQDRLGAHLGGMGAEAANKAKAAASNVTGTGAEQDRYASHFSLDMGSVSAVAQNILNAAENAIGQGNTGNTSRPWMGYDGQQRWLRMASTKGVGAEQDRFGGHFGVDKKSIQNAAQSVTDRVKQAPNDIGRK
jgi:hypothetical protein